MYTRNIFRSDIVFLMCVSFFVWIIYFLLLRNFYDPFLGDGGGYWRGSTNLLNGFYIEDNQTVTHFNIGYPIFIWFLRTIGFNEYGVVFFNFIFHNTSIIILFYTLKKIEVKIKLTIILTGFFALYFPLYQTLPNILSESLTSLLFIALSYQIVNIHQNQKLISLILFSFFLAMLMLTRGLIPYVVLTGFFLLIVWYVFFKKDKIYLHLIMGILIALLFCTPYLIYTQVKTNNFFYWTSQGGSAIYFMSSPFEGDLGDWIGNLDYEEVTSKDYLMDEENRRNSKILNHAKTINLVENLNVFEEDRVLKKLAVENIKRHPTKYLRNWILNINRMFFGTPFSYSQQHPLATLRIMPNAILYSSLVFAIVGLLLFHKIKERKTLLSLLCFLLLYFWFSSLVTSMPRYIYTTTPLVLLIIGGFFNFIYNNLSKK